MYSIESGLTGVGVGDGVEVAVGLGVRVAVGVALGVGCGVAVGARVGSGVGSAVGMAVASGVEVTTGVAFPRARRASRASASLEPPHAARVSNRMNSRLAFSSDFRIIVLFLSSLPLARDL
jgi:hypothetical protein